MSLALDLDDQPDLLARLAWLRAAVLGANDGIVSVAGLVVGVAGATSARGPVLLAGVAGLVAGAASMALGEYASVAGQRDGQRVAGTPHRELARPWQAAGASAASFVLGAALPLLAVVVAPAPVRVPVTVVAVLVALTVAGATSARLGASSVRRGTARVVLGGALGLGLTWALGHLVGGWIG